MKFVDEIKRKFATTVHVGCESLVDEKIARLVSGGPDKLQVISDFDRTISRSEYNNQPTMSSFCVFEMCESLSDEYRGKAAALLQKYRPIEDDTQMTVAEKLPYIEQWWRQSEQLLKGLCFHYDDIEKSIEKADVKLREGHAEAFSKLHSEKIPLIVLSAGIGDVVELTLKHENLWTDNVSVVSNFLKLSKDTDGMCTIEGFKGDKLIHVFNKNEHAYIDTHKNDTHLSGRSNVILLGDSLGDANMDGGIAFDTVLRIGFLNSDLVTRAKTYRRFVRSFEIDIFYNGVVARAVFLLQTERECGYLQQYKLAFDVVLVQDQTMGLLNYLLDEIVGAAERTSSSDNNR